MVEDLNDDEIMVLCILSNELNASRPQQYSIRRSLRHVQRGWDSVKGFAVDLTTARANGTMWDLSLEQNSDECRIENSLNFLREARQVTTFLLC